MNVKETAKVWGIKPYKVLQYIRDGLVPTAELVNAPKEEYEIPEGTPRPPCFRGPAVTMLENIDAIREEGANPYVRGFSYPEVVECYSFFLDCGFIAGFEEPDFQGLDTKGQRKALNAALKCCSITRRGRAFLAGKKLNVVNQKNVNAAVFCPEVVGAVVSDGRDQLIGELFR